MSDDDFDVERLAELVDEAGEYVTGFKRTIVEGGEDEDLLDLADDLWDVLDEVEDVLGTADFEELPDAIDVEELPESVELDDVPEGLLDEDETAIDLGDVQEAVNLRELWDAVDLTDLRGEKQELEDEVDDVEEDVTGDEDGLTGDDGDDEMFENVVGTGEGVAIETQLSQEIVEEKIEKSVEKFRAALLSTHDTLRELYETNQEKLGQPGRQPDSLNPTAYSSLPSGPLPDSASTRASTVPSRVKYSRIDPSRRIYGRRFERRTNRSRADGDESADDGRKGAADTDPEDAADPKEEEVTTDD